MAEQRRGVFTDGSDGLPDQSSFSTRASAVGNANDDEFPDILVGTEREGGCLRLYLNNGDGLDDIAVACVGYSRCTLLILSQPDETYVHASNLLEPDAGSRYEANSDVAFLDVEGDGDMDLVVSNSVSKLFPASQRTRLYFNRFQSEGGVPGDASDEIPPCDSALTVASYPNPFNPITRIHFDVPNPSGRLSLKIYDVAVRLVRTLVEGFSEAGGHDVTWDGRDDDSHPVASGVYLYRLDGMGRSASGKMTLLR